MNVVDRIYLKNHSRPEVPFRRTRKPISLIGSLASAKKRGFTGVICEFKRKSPSGFENDRNSDAVGYFRKLNHSAVSGFSILTEPDYFDGNYDDLSSVQDFGIPILDKDFISTSGMVENAYNAGADAILLILDFLGFERSLELADLSGSFGLDVLMEFHDSSFADVISPRTGVIYGYNRRNLRTLQMEPMEDTVMELLRNKDVGVVLESGIDSAYLAKNDVSRYGGLLIGASIIGGDNIFDLLEKQRASP